MPASKFHRRTDRRHLSRQAADPAWAWAPFQPNERRPWDLKLAGHLYRRAALGASWKQLQTAVAAGPRDTVDQLIRPPAEVAAFDHSIDTFETAAAGSIESLRAWWLRRLILSPHPLQETMTLFWHGHFAVSSLQVQDAGQMRQYEATLRRHALGRFDQLRASVAVDPAVRAGLGSDAVQTVLQQPAAAGRVVGGFYRWLISESQPPDPALLRPLAESFANDDDIGKLVATILRSNLFFSATAYRQRIKSPVALAVGIARSLEASPSTTELGDDLARLGQDLVCPPSSRGWPGGRHWINRLTVVGRSNFAWQLLGGNGRYGTRIDPPAVAGRYGHRTVGGGSRFLFDLFLQADLDDAVGQLLLPAEPAAADPAGRLRRFAHSLVTLPEFQLS